MSVPANAGANPGRNVAWSRRRALQSAGAALVATVGIVEHAQDAAAQSAAGSPAVAATPAIPADFKVVLHAAEVGNWPYVLSNLKNLTKEWGQLAEAGVQVQVCPNALREHGIDPATIPTYAQTNLGGVVALV